ncbi:threonine-phosphate decarboxylase CobD [Rhizobium oryzicola]|uniref:threonine-phosphate decarboxylase n=1 Tax=Rhizobium oryzicola TaxID=1232668 RepID=A0ABT8T443_9HYPH|nr:threonine-phosphate decarboxylase CobD [Rhizobium oryzicola]MDO1585199.1 threonine-phosphate decarboxylase CobD [Rhizobium oryzicola]
MGPNSENQTVSPIDHGGNLAEAERLFPQAPKPWIDLSTGINPHCYPYSTLPATAFSRLPECDDLDRLKLLAAETYAAPSPRHVAAAAGTQILMPLLIQAVFGSRPGHDLKAVILSPTYAEHAHMARLAGFQVHETTDLADLETADLAIIVNPNNPTGRLINREEILTLARHLAERQGLLVVDEAFMDVAVSGPSVADAVHEGLAVFRSFGKFYGLAGVRLGFAVAIPAMADYLAQRLGPWPVPGATLAIAREALADRAWQAAMRHQLADEAARLDDLLREVGFEIEGGTSLFRFVRHERASEVFDRLARAGIWVRRFPHLPHHLRIGLPAATDWNRLQGALLKL